MIILRLTIGKRDYGSYCWGTLVPVPIVIRFHLAAILKQKGWTPYRLSRETGLTVPTAYRLADPELRFGRFTTDTLARL